MIKTSASYAIHNFRVRTKTTKHYTMYQHHFHNEYELFYLNSGTRKFFINDRTYDIEAGNLVLVKPSDLHKTIDTGESHSRILLSFKEDFLPFEDVKSILAMCFDHSKVITFDAYMQQYVEKLLTELINETNLESIYTKASIQCLLLKILVELGKYIEKTAKTSSKDNVVNEKVQLIINYLKENFDRHLTLNELSDKFYISKYYLTRIFKKATGFTVIEYLQSLRIVEAQRLLTITDLSMTDIALKTGFTTASNFGKVFKSVTDMTPLSYRKMFKT